jgi:cell division transport system permease protein
MEKVRYFLGEGLRNIRSNGFVSAASIGVLTICLLLLGSSYLFSENVKNLITQVESKNQIMVYLKDDVSDASIKTLKSDIESMENVKGVTFVSKAEALKNAEKTLGDKSKLLSGFESDNPYPNSFEVAIKDMSLYSQTVKQLTKLTGVENVSDNSPIAAKLTNISRVINRVGIVLFLILIGVSLFLISNAIKIAVFVRRREINIMKFVGATNGFIRWPFVVEGMFIGLAAGVLGIVLQWYVYTGLFSKIFTVLNVTQMSIAGHDALGMSRLVPCYRCVAVGVLGSLISLHKYLRGLEVSGGMNKKTKKSHFDSRAHNRDTLLSSVCSMEPLLWH